MRAGLGGGLRYHRGSPLPFSPRQRDVEHAPASQPQASQPHDSPQQAQAGFDALASSEQHDLAFGLAAEASQAQAGQAQAAPQQAHAALDFSTVPSALTPTRPSARIATRTEHLRRFMIFLSSRTHDLTSSGPHVAGGSFPPRESGRGGRPATLRDRGADRRPQPGIEVRWPFDARKGGDVRSGVGSRGDRGARCAEGLPRSRREGRGAGRREGVEADDLRDPGRLGSARCRSPFFRPGRGRGLGPAGAAGLRGGLDRGGRRADGRRGLLEARPAAAARGLARRAARGHLAGVRHPAGRQDRQAGRHEGDRSATEEGWRGRTCR